MGQPQAIDELKERIEATEKAHALPITAVGVTIAVNPVTIMKICDSYLLLCKEEHRNVDMIREVMMYRDMFEQLMRMNEATKKEKTDA
jgi:hypothetical protein